MWMRLFAVMMCCCLGAAEAAPSKRTFLSLASALAPETLYHFTTATSYESIVASGQLIPGWGSTGFGVYGTALPVAGTVSWAQVPAEAMVSFSPGMSSVGWGMVPGLWWRVTPAITTLFSFGVPVNP
jgi:hypothetical protein